MGGITRIHGSLIAPKNFAGVALRDYTLTFWSEDWAALKGDLSLPAGAFDQIFKTAVGTVASISRVGTLSTGTGVTGNTLRFAIETLGVDAGELPKLGTGPDNAGQGDAGATTVLALQEAIRALGDVTNSAGTVVYLTSATVTAFAY